MNNSKKKSAAAARPLADVLPRVTNYKKAITTLIQLGRKYMTEEEIEGDYYHPFKYEIEGLIERMFLFVEEENIKKYSLPQTYCKEVLLCIGFIISSNEFVRMERNGLINTQTS